MVSTDNVDPQVWEKAQEWERAFWIREQRQLAKNGKNFAWRILSTFGLMDRYRGDDDNRKYRAKQFNGYDFLPTHFEDAIEVGCGPYTNIRLIKDRASIKHLVLSDPLIQTYTGFKRTFVREMWKTGGATFDSHPLEDLPFRDSSFDLAIKINVLDHVRDARACVESLIRVLRPGGWLIIGQDLTNESDLRAQPEGLNLGHPIKLDEAWFRPYLDQFTPTIDKVLSRQESRAPAWHYGTLIFAGRKRS